MALLQDLEVELGLDEVVAGGGHSLAWMMNSSV